eukprot:COSAG06_NODE_12655_length_1346_cov_23.544507_3_plen_37_part_01
MIFRDIYIYKWLKKTVFLPHPVLAPQTARYSHHLHPH